MYAINEKHIIKKYNAGYSISCMAKQLGVSFSVIKRILTKNDINIPI